VTWRWLRQVKVAPYSYDWIDNLGRRSPRTLTAGLADIAVGDELMVFRVVAAEPGREFTGVMTPRAERLFGQISGTYRVTPVDDAAASSSGSTSASAAHDRCGHCRWLSDLMRKQLLTKHLAEIRRRWHAHARRTTAPTQRPSATAR
jgi:hypothetical protein